MKSQAQAAAEALKSIGAPVYDHLAGEHGAHFILGAELRDDKDSYFADYYQSEVREHLNKDGKIVNAFGIRQDVIEILEAHGLFAEWINPGQVGVYDA